MKVGSDRKIDRACASCNATFQGTAAARWCPKCRWAQRKGKRLKRPLTAQVIEIFRERYDSRVSGRTYEIARELGWPKWAVCKAAKELGLARCYPKDRKWRLDEIEFLQKWEGFRSAHWLSKKLKRSETSVILKMKRLDLNRRVRDGYTVHDVARCFGVDHHQVDRWINTGLLEFRKQGTRRPHDIRRTSDEKLRAFASRHRDQYRLDKLDQVWFLGLVFGAVESIARAHRSTA